MELRRVRTESGLETQKHSDGQWLPLDGETPLGPSPLSDDWQLATADRHLQQTGSLLPFAPLSFRDFLVSEQHNVNARRGLVKRFYPGTYRMTRAIETGTHQTYPGFKPEKLFYQEPIYYFGNAMTVVPTGTPIAFPSSSHGLDFELELAWALNAPLYNASAGEATAAIGAFVLLNDFSARDVQRAEMGSGLGPLKTKHFISSVSPTAVTADEILPRLDQLTGSVIINGRTVSTVSTRGLQWTRARSWPTRHATSTCCLARSSRPGHCPAAWGWKPATGSAAATTSSSPWTASAKSNTTSSRPETTSGPSQEINCHVR